MAVSLLFSTLLGYDDIFHLLYGDSTLHIDPLILNDMLLSQFQHKIDTSNIAISHKSESSWLISAFVLQYDTVFNIAKVCEVGPESIRMEVVGQSSDENFSQLRVNLITTS